MGSNAQDNINRGKNALIYFHNEGQKFDDYPFNAVQELYDYLNSQSPKLIGSLGASISDSGLSDNQVYSGMVALADQGQGKLPTRSADYLNFLVDSTVNISWTTIASQAATDSAQQFVKGAAVVGQAAYSGVLGTLGMLPLIIGGAVILFVILKSRAA